MAGAAGGGGGGLRGHRDEGEGSVFSVQCLGFSVQCSLFRVQCSLFSGFRGDGLALRVSEFRGWLLGTRAPWWKFSLTPDCPPQHPTPLTLTLAPPHPTPPPSPESLTPDPNNQGSESVFPTLPAERGVRGVAQTCVFSHRILFVTEGLHLGLWRNASTKVSNNEIS